ncbi:MAG: divergent polysaccharide deacetylase family protein [Alphaproteobacteria bacterium]|nr:divergent polysaccharide deacetylase family protein [Alphaproteobacteria bacterium]
MQGKRARSVRRNAWKTRPLVSSLIRRSAKLALALIVTLVIATQVNAADTFGPRDTEAQISSLAPASAGFPSSFPLLSAALRVPGMLVPDEPWRRFAVRAKVEPGQPAIAIVIDDLGMSAREVDNVLGLGEQLTLSFLPDGADAPWLARYARRAGHEVLVHVPMEPMHAGHRLGAYGLRVSYGAQVNRDRLSTILARFGAYVGINNHMGSRFTSDTESMAPILTELKRRGLMFLDSRTTAATQGNRLAALLEVPHAMRDVFIDAEPTPEAIRYQLARLERVARENGLAIAIGHPHAATLRALRAWLPEAKARGFAFVPISYAARLNCAC